MKLPDLLIKKGVGGRYKIVLGGKDLSRKIGEFVNDREVVVVQNIESLEEAEKMLTSLKK